MTAHAEHHDTRLDFPVGTKVTFKAGPNAKQPTQAEVTSNTEPGGWLLTKDTTGKVRKTRAGNCTKV